ncbi:MAG: hypothetical protein LBQ44_04000 [Treponema sp.]|nr:hypothetical protein [Treponema sp.]
MVEAGEYNCDEYIHLHIIPKENELLRLVVTSPKLPASVVGVSVYDTWGKILKAPDRYKVRDPKELLQPLEKEADVSSLLQYLENRYWNA